MESPRPRRGLWRGTALVAIAGAIVLAAMGWKDVQYFLSPTAPIVIGAEGDYHFDRLRTNRYVQVHGAPSLKGAYSVERGVTWVVIGLRDTPILVRRAALPGEDWIPGRVPPQPDQRPFAVGGRLLGRADGERYREAFDKLGPAEWIILEGEKPRSDQGVLLTLGLLAAFIALNAWLLVRGVRADSRAG